MLRVSVTVASALQVLACGLVLTAACSARQEEPLPPVNPLDPTFGGYGIVTSEFLDSASANAVATQEDGRIVAVGAASLLWLGHVVDGAFALARYEPDGSLDESFGTGGKVTAGFGGFLDYAYAAAIQADGKIVAAGASSNGAGAEYFALARFNTDGTLDPTFGTDGKVITTFGETTLALVSSLAIQGDGKIIAAGTTRPELAPALLVRYGADGSLDSAFGTDGVLTSGILGSPSVAIQEDGRILVAGRAVRDTASVFAVARYEVDGRADATFGVEGAVTTSLATSAHANFVAAEPDGRIVVVGSTWDDSHAYFAVTRYHADGTHDEGFGSRGVVTTAMGSRWDVALTGSIQRDGRIVAAGFSTSDLLVREFAVARYNADGTLDATFGNGGKAITGVGRYHASVNATAIQQDGKIVAAGFAVVDWGIGTFALARYIP